MRVVRAAAGIASAGLLVVGCGQSAATIAVSSGRGGGEELFAAMAEAQQDAGSYRFDMTVDVDGVEISGSGEATFGESLADQSMSMTMAMPGGMGDYEMRVIDAKVYMSTAMLGLPGSDQWLVIDPAGDDPFSEIFGDLMGDLTAGADLQGQLSEYSDLIEVEEIGSAEIDGVDVTEYTITSDVAAAAEFMGLDEELVGELPADEVTSTLFVDGDALAREMRTDLGDQGTMTIRFYDYGAEVIVEEPADEDVTDLMSFFEELTGQELSEEDLAELAEMFSGN